MTDVSWVVESIPGNATSTVYLNGSVQEILKQLIDINSNYPALLDQYWASKASVAPLDGFVSLKAMSEEPRLCSWCDVCTKRWKPAAYMVTLDGINYLRNLTGQPGNKPGPGSCGRISCEWYSAIYWCNDNDQEKTLDSWGKIADAAEDITRQCFWYDRSKSLMTGGQIFEPGGWNVIVRHDDHDC